MTNALRSPPNLIDPSDFAHAPVLRHAETDAELRSCWPVMQQLRPHLASADDFIARVHRMRAVRYHLLAAWQGEVVLALGGYHLMENLVYGSFLYVDDLVTLDTVRGHRWGKRLIDAMTRIAEEAGCTSLVEAKRSPSFAQVCKPTSVWLGRRDACYQERTMAGSQSWDCSACYGTR